ncbi:MAG: 1-deoxy-D-xylulose-5-phosphate synthase [Eubacterium sp.]|nr:1-deoxy-D-xylulose-5-phosphate synthase [Eubacterium sp.]
MSAEYIKSLTTEQRRRLCTEIRAFLVRTVTETGGHLASNLGTVELMVALHSVFTTPEDKMVFDVGHQAYVHKLITGRAKKMNTLRSEGGISGFPRGDESEHDAFLGGHSSISISAALGIAEGMKLDGDDHSVVAVIGDGAFTGGEAYEGINNAGKTDCNLVVVLNENEMSISKNTGAFALYLAQIRSSQKYYHTKKSVKGILEKTPLVGKGIGKAAQKTKKVLRAALYNSNLFENLGFKYLGPIDGHNLEELTEALTVAKLMKRPCLVHVYTKKGKGYIPAESNSGEYHGIPPKNRITTDAECFNEHFGRTLRDIARGDDKICAVTAAMKYGTGLQYFAKEFPERFFDVGIAEQHAVTFCAGLAAQDKIPVFAVYSSFLQRSYDQLIHDCAIENRHIVLAVDRAGFVGEDGETHHGVFDIPMLTSVPNMTIYSPSDTRELELCLKKAIYDTDGIAAVRYPRGGELYQGGAAEYKDYNYFCTGKNKLIFTYGRITANALALKEYCDVLQAVKVFPIQREIIDICMKYNELFFFEESEKSGGISEKLAAQLVMNGYRGKITVTAPQGFMPQACVQRQLEKAHLDVEGMKKIVIGE